MGQGGNNYDKKSLCFGWDKIYDKNYDKKLDLHQSLHVDVQDFLLKIASIPARAEEFV